PREEQHAKINQSRRQDSSRATLVEISQADRAGLVEFLAQTVRNQESAEREEQMDAERTQRTEIIEPRALNRTVRHQDAQNRDAAKDIERRKVGVLDVTRRRPARTRSTGRRLLCRRRAETARGSRRKGSS